MGMIPAKMGGKKAMIKERVVLTQRCGKESPLWQLCIRPGEQLVHRREGFWGLSLGKMGFPCNILIEKQKKLEYTLNSLLIFFQQEKQKAIINLRKKTVTQSHGHIESLL